MSRPPRIAGFEYKGLCRYLITCCTHLRRPIFLDDEIASGTLAQFRLTAIEDRFAIVAYCVMPDHVHLLVEGSSVGSDLRRFVRIAKQRAASWYSRAVGGRLWQAGYHDRVLRRDDDLRIVARYVLENPIRAGLVTIATDYKHSGSDIWSITDILSE